MIEVYVYNFQMFCVLPIGGGFDLTFGLEWINGTYANNFSIKMAFKKP